MTDLTFTDTPWYVLQVRPRSERKAYRQLKDLKNEKKDRPALDLEVCVPTQRRLHQWSDRRKWVDEVLFNNYVFVSIAPGARNQVFISPHVIGYLRFDGHEATLTQKEVGLIKTLSGLTTPVEITYDDCKVGDRVEVLSGPLKDHYGWVRGVNSSSRMVLEMPSLGCFARVEVGGEEIKVVN